MVEAAGSIHEAGLNAGVSPGSCISSVLAWWRWLDIVLAVQPESLGNLDRVLLMLIRVGVRSFKERR